MTSFIDGPAAGQSLMLRRAAVLLRVTRKRFALSSDPEQQKAPVFDALDAPEDTPNADEEIFVYVNTHQRSGNCHVRFGGKQRSASGFYSIADYRLYDVQPADEIMRDNTKWSAWCEEQRPRLYPSS